jgi:hypothetical protein
MMSMEKNADIHIYLKHKNLMGLIKVRLDIDSL